MAKTKKEARVGDRHAGQQFTMRFDGEEKALLEKLGARYKGKKAAVIAGLRAINGAGEPSNDQLIELLRRRLR